LGGDKESNFSWWVEYGTASVAAMGGYASKHRLRFHSRAGQYKYPASYKSADECFEDIKANVLRLYDLIREDRLGDFREIDLPHNQKVKLSYLLDSRRLLPVLDATHLSKICTDLGIDPAGLNSLMQNRRILDWFRSNAVAKEWHTWKIGSFCYSPQGFRLKDDARGAAALPAAGDVVTVLLTKKQIVLYGPPGTGKTHTTRSIALSTIHGIDSTLDLAEYEQLANADPEETAKIPSSPVWTTIHSFTRELAGVESRRQPSMMAYYSASRASGKKIGLAWLEYPETLESPLRCTCGRSPVTWNIRRT
jgi:hypothetical protein